MIRQLTAIVALGVFVLLTGFARADDQDKFQGMWKPQKAVVDGMELPAETTAKMAIEFKGNKATAYDGDRSEKEEEFKLDGSKSPKTIDIKRADGKLVPGIYEFDGETLKICFSVGSDMRPTKFESPEGSKSMFLVLKKQAK
jgi:uncharacterized protein (TIGR03067 family)